MAKPIEKFLLKISVQKCVYWGTPENNGYGKLTFADPVELAVRWEGSTKIITDANGIEYMSKAEVIVNQDIDKEGYLYLGTLSDLSDAQKADPQLVEGAYKIVQFDKIPMIFKTDEFVRRAFL